MKEYIDVLKKWKDFDGRARRREYWMFTVGIHADVGENTDIKVFVYDGKDTEPYTR